MNGVHDMGGEHGMGPIQYEKDEPVFHAAWEGRIYAMNRLMGAWRKWNLHSPRPQIDLLPQATYSRMGSTERGVEILTEPTEKGGPAPREELERGTPPPGPPKPPPPVTTANVATALIRVS